jgi:hypothetical protein
MFEDKQDFLEKGLERQVSRFKAKENIDKKTSIVLNKIQSYFDVFFEYLNKKNTSNAVGVGLDRIGEKFGPLGLRNGRDDEAYRNYLATLPARLRNAGQHEVIISVFKTLTGALKVEYVERPPMSAEFKAVVVSFDDVSNLQAIKSQMDEVRALGVKLDFSLKLEQGSFALSPLPSGDIEAGRGLADSPTGSNGGILNLGLK